MLRPGAGLRAADRHARARSAGGLRLRQRPRWSASGRARLTDDAGGRAGPRLGGVVRQLVGPLWLALPTGEAFHVDRVPQPPTHVVRLAAAGKLTEAGLLVRALAGQVI